MLLELLGSHTGKLFESGVKYRFGIEYWSHKIVLHLQIASYLIAIAYVLIRYRRRLKEFYSSIEKIDLAWSNLLLFGFTVMWSLDFLNWILSITSTIPGIIQHWMFISSLSINFIFALAITYKGISQSESFSGIQEEVPKYKTSRLKQSDCEEICQKLTEYMKKEKPFLSPTISVEDLALKLEVPTKHLSQAIHTTLNKSFYDLINFYRVEEIKERLLDENSQNLTLLAIAFNAGFNSKSVFNSAFKKFTGMTPKQFKQHLSSSKAA